jgi:GTP cyclohydrolase II
MKPVLPVDQNPMTQRVGAAPDPEVLRLRTVHRAAADLRRGAPVVLAGEAPLVLLAAETAGPRGLVEFD